MNKKIGLALIAVILATITISYADFADYDAEDGKSGAYRRLYYRSLSYTGEADGTIIITIEARCPSHGKWETLTYKTARLEATVESAKIDATTTDGFIKLQFECGDTLIVEYAVLREKSGDLMLVVKKTCEEGVIPLAKEWWSTSEVAASAEK